MPIMAFFVAEGFKYTKNVKKYALRLFIFSVISWIPFCLLFKNTLPVTIINGIRHIDNSNFFKKFILYLPIEGLNKTVRICFKTDVIYTLFLSLSALIICESKKIPNILKAVLVFLLCALSINGEYSYITIMYTLVFYYSSEKKMMKYILFYCVALFYAFGSFSLSSYYKFGVLLFPVIMIFYNGENGRKNKFNKWFFYIFYPAHLILLYIIKSAIA